MRGRTFTVTDGRGRDFYATIEDIYAEKPEPGFDGYIEVEFEVYNKGFKPITHKLNQKILNRIEKQLIKEIQTNSLDL